MKNIIRKITQTLRRGQASEKFTCMSCWAGENTPYNRMMYRGNAFAFQASFFAHLFDQAGIQDGDEVEITVKRTGKRPYGERRIVLQEPHTYDFETDEQMKARLR